MKNAPIKRNVMSDAKEEKASLGGIIPYIMPRQGMRSAVMGAGIASETQSNMLVIKIAREKVLSSEYPQT